MHALYVCLSADILVCSAGVSRPGRLEEIPLEMYERMMSVNYLGSLYAALAVAPLMKQQQGGGRLMFVSSLAGLAGTYESVLSCCGIVCMHTKMWMCSLFINL
jgi:NAD(P)-dependent dehydrogenase (short-subunit alcohol dehydrogenase family)